MKITVLLGSVALMGALSSSAWAGPASYSDLSFKKASDAKPFHELNTPQAKHARAIYKHHSRRLQADTTHTTVDTEIAAFEEYQGKSPYQRRARKDRVPSL